MESSHAVLEWRPATAEDEPFLLEVSYRTMGNYLATYQLSSEEDMKAWLKLRNGKFRWFVALFDGEPVLALAFTRSVDRINIDSIHVLPEWQNRGFGTEAIRRIQRWAAEQKLPVILQVIKSNTEAKRLYERLGFTFFHEDERNYHLWCPQDKISDPPVPLNYIGKTEVENTRYGVVLKGDASRNNLSQERKPVTPTLSEKKTRKNWLVHLFHRNRA
jgi:ribosomal protein S18 acetylase RimI-like enzyme